MNLWCNAEVEHAAQNGQKAEKDMCGRQLRMTTNEHHLVMVCQLAAAIVGIFIVQLTSVTCWCTTCNTQLLNQKMSSRILKEARAQQQEVEHEEDEAGQEHSTAQVTDQKQQLLQQR